MKVIIAALFAASLWGQIDINTQTKGTLNINRGGCGAVTAAGCLSNLGGVGVNEVATLTNKTLTAPKINSILDVSNSSTVIQFLSAIGATEGLSITPSVAASPVIVSTFGVGTDVDLQLDPKGAGILRLPVADEILVGDGSTGQFMRKAANGRMEWATIAGTGTVTSVGLSGIASFITVSGSPITTSGSFSLALASQSQNAVFAGPTSGSGTPTFRALVAGDIPNLDAAKITTGAFATARVVTGTVTNSRCLHVDGSGNITVASADCGTGSGGITAINSQVGPSITVTQGTSGADFQVASGSNIITINCPNASASARGCLTSTDWSTFNNKVNGPGIVTTVNNFVTWADINATTLTTGIAGSTGITPNTVAMRDGNADLYASWYKGNSISVSTGFFVSTGGGIPAVRMRRDNDAFPGTNIAEFRRYDDVSNLSAIDWSGNFTGKSATTDAFSSNPANCGTPGQAAAGINASGVAEGCFTPTLSGNGLSIYNVKDSPYNATGDGVADDTAEIAAAIAACEDSTRGGIVYFPPGIYGITSALWHGNGSTTGSGNPSSKAVCRFVGSGPGDSSFATGGANVQISAIKWIGSNPGSPAFMLTIDGPMFGWGMENLQLWANSNSNVYGLDARHINFSHIKNVAIMDTGGGSGGGFAMKIWPQKTASLYACFNTFENLRIRVATGLAGSGLWVGGNSTYGTACSINIIGGYINRDNNYVSGTNTATYSILADSSDNLHVAFTHLSHTGGNGLRNGCSVGASVGAFSGAGVGVYPDSAQFYGVSSEGMCGTTGSGRPFIVWGGECGAGGEGSCDYHNAFTGGGTKPIALSGETDMSLKGMKEILISNGGSSGTTYMTVRSTTGTDLFTMGRGGPTGSGIDFNAFNEVRFLNPSFFEAQLKIRPGAAANPGACSSTNEGWLWSKGASAGVATTLLMCTANSAGVWDWRTVQTF